MGGGKNIILILCDSRFNLSNPPIDWTVQLGMTRRSSHSYFGQKLKVARVIRHPLYDRGIPHNNDIALFQVSILINIYLLYRVIMYFYKGTYRIEFSFPLSAETWQLLIEYFYDVKISQNYSPSPHFYYLNHFIKMIVSWNIS